MVLGYRDSSIVCNVYTSLYEQLNLPFKLYNYSLGFESIIL